MDAGATEVGKIEGRGVMIMEVSCSHAFNPSPVG